MKSVILVVKIQKKKSFGSMAGGVEVDNSFASHATLGERLWSDIMSMQYSSISLILIKSSVLVT